MSIAAAIDRFIEPNRMDKDPTKEPAAKPLYRYHSYTPASVTAGQPRSPSPSSFSPSPYVINYKGRRTGAPDAGSALDKGSTSKFRDPGPSEQPQPRGSVKPAVLDTKFESQDRSFAGKQTRNGFYSSQDDMVGKTRNDKQALFTDDKKSQSSRKQEQQQQQQSLASSGYGEEFFDAPESPFEGGDETSSQCEFNASNDPAPDHSQHQDELERCRQAEEALEIVLQKLAAGGLALPPTFRDNGSSSKSQVEEVRERVADLDIAGQLLIKRLVEAAVARGAARAEIEENLEAELENKSREVTRLRDKVRYNELVNREMSQRNQEAIETARIKRRARQRKIRWAVASASAAVAVGLSAALVYKYGPWQDVKLWKSKLQATQPHQPPAVEG